MTLGILFLLISFVPWLFKLAYTNIVGVLFALSWGIGYLLICNAIIGKYSKDQSKMSLRISHMQALVVGAVLAVLIEALGNWAWKLWYYPHFSVPFYLLTMLGIQIVYFYFILRGYMATRAFLLAHGFRTKVVRRYRRYRVIFTIFGILGTLGLILGLIQILGPLNYPGLTFFNSYGVRKFNLMNVVVVSISILLILEYLEYRAREDTFLLHLIQGDWTPLLIVIMASAFTAVTMEGFNIPLSIWLYTNWPLPSIAISGLPLTVLLAWPIQYLWLISVYRLAYKRQTAKIWY